MSHPTELEIFCTIWDEEANGAIRLMEALPPDQYDFRPDPDGRSLGELAWHLSEIDACLTFGIAAGRFSFADEPPDLKRPREVQLLAPGYRKVTRPPLHGSGRSIRALSTVPQRSSTAAPSPCARFSGASSCIT